MQTTSPVLCGRPQIWAVGGGKGGTGKSLVAASLGIHLAQMGRRVILVDGDLGAPNLHTVLGMDSPPLALSDFVKRRFESIETVVLETGVPRLSLISGARNSLDIESLKHFQKTRLLRVLLGLPADVVLLDLGAGTSLNVLDLFSLADRGLMVILPEPTSIENCYRFLKAAFLRRLDHLGRTLGYQSIIDLVMEHRDQSDQGRPSEILDEIARIDSCAAAAVASHVETYLPHLVINQVRSHEDERLGEAMEWISERFVRIPLRFAGAIPYDTALVQCLKSRRAYLSEYPRSRTAEMLRAVAESFAAPGRPGAGHVPDLRVAARRASWLDSGRCAPVADPYRTLDLRPGAMHDEVLSAYLRLRRTLRSDSPALASLDCEAERRATVVEIEEAYRSLSRNVSPRTVRPARPVRSSSHLL
ncbi:MAG: P-loop NTPase [Acidobacteria bacterium]|nr:P-loop NTPase [Acidobacteriota bacterium]